MKQLILSVMGLALLATSCKKESSDYTLDKELVPGATVDTLVGDITFNTTVSKTTYLKGIVYVRPGVTLTVNPGVTIKGSLGPGSPDLSNQANNKGTLVVMAGGKLIANGTASNPIIWTSENTTAGTRNYGDWGGVVLYGQAPIITSTGASTNSFEGLRIFSVEKNTYGGNLANDNSGSMTYNRIEFAGGVVAAANQEVNGLTLCGVGAGTVLHHVEVSNSGDDGFEFFGGTVNVDHLLSFGNKDDDYDFDEGFQGRLQFIIAYRNDLADNSGSEIIELDNNAASFVGAFRTLPFIANATFVGPTSLTPRAGSLGRFDGTVYVRRQGRIRLVNSIIAGQALPSVVASTNSTDAAMLVQPITADGASPIANNIFQTSSATPVVKDADESNPISPVVNDPLLQALIANSNSAVGTFADYKLDGALKPLAGSPALSGGLNLSAFGFIGTVQRGAVLTNDIWTAQPWISISIN